MLLSAWLGWLAALLQLDDSGKYLRSLLNTCGRPLLTGKGVEAQTEHKDCVVKGGQSPGSFLSLPMTSANIFTSLRSCIFK